MVPCMPYPPCDCKRRNPRSNKVRQLRPDAMRALRLALLATALLVSSCTVYQTAPGVYSPVPPPAASFDRSFSAAVGAFQDQGVQILSADQSTGVVRGTRDGINVTANVRTQADGSVRVEFGTSGATSRDPGLISRISSSYDARMGR